jgi:anti-anti-sigma factor
MLDSDRIVDSRCTLGEPQREVVGGPDPRGVGPVTVIGGRTQFGHTLNRRWEARPTRAGQFWLDEQSEPAGGVRLMLSGELDLATADQLSSRLRALCASGRSVVLDLAQLEFIDSSGIRELVRAVSGARRDGWSLSLDPTMAPQVLRIIELLGLRDLFWPAI